MGFLLNFSENFVEWVALYQENFTCSIKVKSCSTLLNSIDEDLTVIGWMYNLVKEKEMMIFYHVLKIK